MLTFSNEFSYTPLYPIKEHSYFFCIDTTGFQPEASAIIMIGMFLYSKGKIIQKQWFNDNGLEQKQILEAFFQEIKPGYPVITYYGNRFSLPFIEKKCQEYHMENPLSSMDSKDLYEILFPIRKILGLSSCRQAILETKISYSRSIKHLTGKKLVTAYQNYVKNRDSSVAAQFLLHNQESLDALLALTPIFSYEDLFEGKIKNCSIQSSDLKQLCLHFELKAPLLNPVDSSNDNYRLCIEGTCGTLFLFLNEEQKFKHFFPNPKDYDYLSVEDRAIHKSLAAFVSKEYRKKATYDTCYEWIGSNHPSLLLEDSVHKLIFDTLRHFRHTMR